MNSHSIKTRFAPSPTGDLHIGSLRTALFAYLFAKKNNGQFFLRIEDTDQARYKEGSVETILDGLRWAGIKWDSYKSEIQNPKSEINPKFNPRLDRGQNSKEENHKGIIFQSSRLDVYQKYANELVPKGEAYYCFCSAQRLEEMRLKQIKNKLPPKYDRRCLKLSKDEIARKIKAGEPHVIRLKIPDKVSLSARVPIRQRLMERVAERREAGGVGEKITTPTPPSKGGEGKNAIKFTDLIRGQVEFALKDLDDQILLKSDGFPTYHLACVVDDHEMGITHVIRAEEWLSSTPKHIILYHYFNWQIPEFAHLSMILAPDKSKLSKRHDATSVLEFKKLGYLPEVLINYVALLGWNPGDDREIFTLQELEKEFSLERVQKAGAIFDINKLDWMNGHYIRGLDLEKLADLCLPYLTICHPELVSGSHQKSMRCRNKFGMTKKEYIKKVVALEQERLKKLSDIGALTDYFFQEPEYEKELLQWRKSDLVTAKRRLEFLAEELPKVPEKNWTRHALEEFVKELIEAHKLGTGETLWPLRAALTGRENSPGPFEVAEVLGKEESLKRIEKGIKKI